MPKSSPDCPGIETYEEVLPPSEYAFPEPENGVCAATVTLVKVALLAPI